MIIEVARTTERHIIKPTKKNKKKVKKTFFFNIGVFQHI